MPSQPFQPSPYYRPRVVDAAPQPDGGASPLPPLSAQTQNLADKSRMIAPSDPQRSAVFARQAQESQAELQRAAELDMRLRRYRRAAELQSQAEEQRRLAPPAPSPQY